MTRILTARISRVNVESRKLDLIRKVCVPIKTGIRRSLGVEIRRLG